MIDPVDSDLSLRPIYRVDSPQTAPMAPRFQVKDTLESAHPPESDIPVRGAELYVKSALALTLGIAPFSLAKGGEGIMKLSAWAMQGIEKISQKWGTFGWISGYASRIVLALPLIVGAVIFALGTKIFSHSQKLIWGRTLVSFPQQEKVNTRLARYGAGVQPWIDSATFIKNFLFTSSPDREALLSQITHFAVP